MSAPAVIDSLEFARSEQQLRGTLPVASLKRLEDVLFDTAGNLDYQLSGTRDKRKRAQLALSITGRLHLQCQRCLGLLDYPVDVASVLLLVPRGAQPEEDIDDPEAPNAIEASAELDLAGLIEDEVLISLPLAPRHPERACESRLAEHKSTAPISAFSQLATLKGSRDKPRS